MDTYIVYFDETGDDGNNTSSSSEFVLTRIFVNANDWQENYETIRKLRKDLKEEFGFHIKQEINTKHLVRDKGGYRQYNWTDEQRRSILVRITKCIANLDIKLLMS